MSLTWRRLRHRPGRTLLVSAGVAVAVAFLAGVAGGSVISEDLSLRHALKSLPAAERVLRVSWSGQVFTSGYGALDRDARRALTSLTSEPIGSSVELADVILGGQLVKLGATSMLRDSVALRSGRLPSRCDLARCEVVQTSGVPVSRIDDAGVHLVVVGRGTLTSLVPFGEGGLATRKAGAVRPEPILLGADVPALARLAPLVELNRNYTWNAQLSPSTIHVWAIGDFLAAEGRALQRLIADDPQFALDSPDDALSSSKSESQTASRRVLLVGGSAALLLLAFAGVTAGALRRDARAELRRLSSRGASRVQQHAFVLGEATAAVLPGAVVGLVAGALVDALIARDLALPWSAPLTHGLVTAGGLALVVAGAVGAVAAVVFALRRREEGARSGVRPVDMAALGATVALVLLLVRGEDQGGSFGSGSAVDLAATPLLASFAFSVLLGRLLEPALRVAVRWARAARVPSSLLMALLTLHRSRGRTVGVVGFLAVAAGLATFVLSYRATLDTSTSDRAAYAVPLDYSLTIGPALVSPRDVASLARYRSLAPGVGAFPILRQAAEVANTGGTPATPTALGVPWSAFRLIHGWRSDFSADGPATLGRLLRPARSVALAGATIPSSATSLELPVELSGAAIQLALEVLTRTGDADELLPPFTIAGSHVLRVAVPAADRGGRIVALKLELPSGEQKSAAHQEAEAGSSEAFVGALRLRPLTAVTDRGREPVASFGSWQGHGGVTATPEKRGLLVRFRIGTSEEAMLRPQQPFDTQLLPVVASPDVASAAGPDGVIGLDFGTGVVRARLVAVARRFPTTQDAGESFVVADEASLASAIGATDLPSSIPDEVWLSTPPAAGPRVGTELARQPFSSLAVASRSAIEADLRDEPLARGIVELLLIAAIAALVLALVGLALVTAGFLRDEGDLLFDLESQGVGPRALGACLRWRALALAAVGLVGGAVLGVVMVLATERLLALDATLTLPDPPLRRVAPWLVYGVASAAFALVAAAMIELSLRIAYRGSAAGREWTGEGWTP
jgi:hypothetical protein